jgi:hypothetical protein
MVRTDILLYNHTLLQGWQIIVIHRSIPYIT